MHLQSYISYMVLQYGDSSVPKIDNFFQFRLTFHKWWGLTHWLEIFKTFEKKVSFDSVYQDVSMETSLIIGNCSYLKKYWW